MTPAGTTRMLRRRTLHRSRSVAVVLVLVLLVLVAAYVGVECVLAAVGARALLISPADAVREWPRQPAIAIGAAVVLAVVGLVALVSALTIGRRARHVLADDRALLVVDDDVLAGALSGRVARRFGLAGSQLTTELGRRRATVVATPTSGRPLDEGAVRDEAADYATALGVTPAPRVRARVERNGVIGA